MEQVTTTASPKVISPLSSATEHRGTEHRALVSILRDTVRSKRSYSCSMLPPPPTSPLSKYSSCGCLPPRRRLSTASDDRSSRHVMFKPSSSVFMKIDDQVSVDYGYGEQHESSSPPESPFKRRKRFQRRNSKTSAMLFKSLPTSYYMDPTAESSKNDSQEATTNTTSSSLHHRTSAWNDDIRTAHELVQEILDRKMARKK